MNVGRYLRGEDRHVGTARTTQFQQPQRTWVTLTEDEIVLISADCASTHQHTDIHFAKAIEAKLKDKNI
jgi:hypothetical protein